MSEINMVLAAGWFIAGEELKIFHSHLNLYGASPAYLSVEGKQSKAYAIFDCKDWGSLTVAEQVHLMMEELPTVYVSLPYKKEDYRE